MKKFKISNGWIEKTPTPDVNPLLLETKTHINIVKLDSINGINSTKHFDFGSHLDDPRKVSIKSITIDLRINSDHVMGFSYTNVELQQYDDDLKELKTILGIG